nr:hypothetical protein [Rhodopila globiformis]
MLDLAIANRMATAMARHDGGQPGMVETRNPARHGIAGAAANKLRSRRVTLSSSHSQQSPSTADLRRRGAGRAAQSNQRNPLGIPQRT